jgi:hypothetical protein
MSGAPRLVFPPEYGLPPVPPPTGPCFKQPDPLLEEPPINPAGWFASLEAGAVATHVKDRLSDQVRLDGRPFVFRVPSADLDWTVAPRVELGYRVGHGFGEFLIAYRNVTTEGEQFTSAEGAAQLKSRVNENVLDLDYANRDLPLGPGWDLRWKVGIRLASVFFDTRSSQGGGTLLQRTSSNLVGAGPHTGLEVARELGIPGLSFYAQADFASVWAHLHQEFQVESLTPAAAPAGGQVEARATQAALPLGAQLGLRWTPPRYDAGHFFVGYQFEQWWQVFRNDNTGSAGNLTEHGIFFRGEINF